MVDVGTRGKVILKYLLNEWRKMLRTEIMAEFRALLRDFVTTAVKLRVVKKTG